MRPSLRTRVFVRPLRLASALAIAAALAACSTDAPDTAPATATPAAAPAPAASAPVAPAAPDAPLSSLDADALAVRIDSAIADNRLYAPESDNAIEYYLAQRERATADAAATEAALIELQPYAMIAAEQAIVSGDLGEAERLVALMARIDGAAPSLMRLRDDIEAARLAQVEAEAREAAAAEAQAEAQAEAAATPVAAPTSTPVPARRPAPAPVRPAPAPERTTSAARATPTTTTAVSRPPAPANAAPARPAAKPASTELVPVNTPFPPFPSEAIARGRSMGSVTVRFTVRANGRVADVRIVEARPAGLFERTVNETLAEWRFEPIAADQVQTRTFNFRN